MIGINFGAHPAPTAPGFVAYAPVAHAEWFHRAVLDALPGERAARRHVAVLDPIAHFARRTASNVAREIRLCANQPAQVDEFVRPEAAVFDVTAPMNVDALWAPFERTNSVAPVIIVCVAAARPAQYGNAQFLQGVNGLLAIAVDVGDRRIFSDPQTTIHAGSEVLRKVTVKFRPHRANFFVRAHRDLARCARSGADEARNQRAERHSCGMPDKSAPGNFREHWVSLS